MGNDSTSGGSMLSRRDELERFTHDRFAELLIRNGFVEAPAERSAIATIVSFTHGDRGFAITLEFREMRVDLDLLRLVDGNLPEPGYISGGQVVYTPEREDANYRAPHRSGRIVGGEVVRIPLLTRLQDVLHVDDAVVATMRTIWQIDALDFDTAVVAVKAWEAVVDRHLAVLETQPLSVLFPSADDFYRIMMPKE